MQMQIKRAPWGIFERRGTPAQAAARQTLAVIGALEQAGCQVLAATAVGKEGPCVRIRRPPAGLFETYGFRQPPPLTVRVPVDCVAERDGVRVVWIERRAG